MPANENDLGGKVGLDITDFKSNISELNRQIKVIDSGFKAAAAGMDDWSKSEEGLQARIKSLSEITDLQRKRVEALTGEYKRIVAEKGENSKAAQDLQIRINKETESLNKNETELRKNASTLESVGNEAKTAAGNLDTAGKAAQDSADKAEKGENAWSKLSDVLAAAAKAAATAAAAAGAAAVAAGSALVGASVSGAKYADDILTQATQTGIATDKLQEYKYASELVDVSTETLTKSMAKNIKSMASAKKGTGEMAEAYKKLGVNVTDANGNLLDGEDVYWKSIDALGQIQNETERDAIAMQLFGKSAQELNPLIEAGSEKMQELGKQAREAGYVLSDDALKAFGEFDDQLQYLKVGAEGAKNALGTVLLPMLTNLAGNGVDLLGEFTRGVAGAGGDIGKIGDVIAGIIPKAIDIVMKLLPTLIDTGMKVVGAIGKGILNNLPIIISASVNIVLTLLKALIDALPQIVDGALQLVIALATGIAGALPELVPSIVQMVMTIVEGLINNLPLLVNAALQLVVGLAKGIVNALPELIAKAPEIITALINGLVESIPMLVDAAIQIILAMVDFLTDPENLGMLINAAIQIVMAIASGLIQAIPQIFAAVAKLISSIWEKFKSTNWGELGANIIKGIANGIKNGVKAIADAAKNAAKTALDAAKNLLGIHSPSEVMRREVGMQIGAGMAKGVEDSRKQVQAAMSKLNDEIDTDPVAGGVGGSRGTGSVIVYVQNEMTMEGQVVTKKISRYQYKNNNTYSRSKGVVTI